MNGIIEGKPYYRACVWIKNGTDDALFMDYFTTKREAISAIKRFKKNYTGQDELDCYARLLDEDGNAVCDFDV